MPRATKLVQGTPEQRRAALQRALAAGDEHATYEQDAQAIAKVVRRWWGGEAATVLELALQQTIKEAL